MGQRFQVYVRYNGGKNLFAMYLQWSWGHYSVIRSHQLLTFIKESIKDKYNPFMSEHIDLHSNYAYRIISHLTQINNLNTSFVGGCDLMEEAFEYPDEGANPSKIKMDPFAQDNNDGILIIDVQEIQNDTPSKDKTNKHFDGKVKYCFDFLKDDFEPISARNYYTSRTDPDYNSYKENEYKNSETWNEEDKQYYKTIEKMLDKLDEFELLTADECEEIFNTEYDSELNIQNYNDKIGISKCRTKEIINTFIKSMYNDGSNTKEVIKFLDVNLKMTKEEMMEFNIPEIDIDDYLYLK